VSRRRSLPATTAGLGALALALAAAAPAASAASAVAAGHPDPRAQRLQRVTAPTGERPAGSSGAPGRFRPSADGTVDAVLELSVAPVSRRQEQARGQGRSLSPAARGDVRAEVARQQEGALPAVRATGAQVRARFADALNGIRVHVAASALPALARVPGVTAVRPVATYHPTNAKGDTLVTAPQAWGDVGATGQGVKIAVIDSGLDYYHADFGGSGNPVDFSKDTGLTTTDVDTRGQVAFPNAKVIGGQDLVGDFYNGGVPNADYPVTDNTPLPDADPLPSCTKGNAFDHGTHVAGTAAGQGVTTDGKTYAGPYDASTLTAHSFTVAPGTAPEATLLAYRVFGCSGSTNVVVDAINDAVRDGANVINMSLGSDYGTADSADAVASDNASRAGVTVVISAGNPGQRPYLVGSPSTSTRAISVAANDAATTFDGAIIGTSPSVSAVNANGGALPVTGAIKVLRDSSGGVALGCSQSDYGDATGTIVVTKRGDCDRVARAKFGQAAHATAVVLINNTSSYPPLEGTIPGVTIPFLGVRGDGPSETTLLANDGKTVTVTAAQVANPSYRAVAGFSAGGPRIGDSALKPDVTAPGVGTVSALVGSGTGPLTLSGTSMASPTTAGIVADIVSKRPGLTPALVKAALMSTADPSGVADYNVLTAGAGLAQARRAVDTAGVLVTGEGTSSLSFGYLPRSGAIDATRALTLQNLSGSALTYDLVGTFNRNARGAAVTVTPSSITVPGHSTQQVDVRVTLDPAAVAALPSAEPASGNGSLTTVAGNVTATPRTSGAGIYPLGAPFLLVPRGLSAITPGNATPYTFGPSSASTTVPVTNAGVHAGRQDVYAWQLTDAQDNVAPQADIRDVGVKQFDTGGSGLGLEFLVNMHGRWSTPGQVVTDINVDTNRDGTPDFLVEAADGELALAGAPDGTYVTAVYDLSSGSLVKTFNAEAPENSSTMGLFLLASTLGLTDASGPFSYSVTTYDFETGGKVDTTGSARYDPFHPPVSSGDAPTLAPGASRVQPLTVHTAALATQPTLGWLFASFDDANGGAQADEVPLTDTNGLTPTLAEVPAAALLLLPGLAAVGLVVRRRGRRARLNRVTI